MSFTTARELLGFSVIADNGANDDPTQLLGTVENITFNTKSRRVDGLLLGASRGQLFLPIECVIDRQDHALVARAHPTRRPSESRRILGLSAWTTNRMFVGFVYNIMFDLDFGYLETVTVHQLLRTWDVPATAIAKITPRSIVIDSDTTLKLKITPYETGSL